MTKTQMIYKHHQKQPTAQIVLHISDTALTLRLIWFLNVHNNLFCWNGNRRHQQDIASANHVNSTLHINVQFFSKPLEEERT